MYNRENESHGQPLTLANNDTEILTATLKFLLAASPYLRLIHFYSFQNDNLFLKMFAFDASRVKSLDRYITMHVRC